MRIVVFAILLLNIQVNAQVFNANRVKILSPLYDTLKIDTLSINPQFFVVSDLNKVLIDSNLYKVDYLNSNLIIEVKNFKNYDKIRIDYKVLPYDFSKPYYHKKQLSIENDDSDYYNFYYNYQGVNSDKTSKQKLNRSGSISRGISIGNNQNAVVNSSLNLQLSGKLNNEFDILASISDNNIPIQPDGNTQQLQEFDKVFIQISNNKTRIKVGDIETQHNRGYFLRYNKRVQGAYFSNRYEKNQVEIVNEISTAVSKGQFTRKSFNGIEGIQGPYRLSGANNETYIIIIAGTERVYIDGVLLKRGLENDYTINYNTGEIYFTTNQVITKDKRIIVEYEYTDRNYTRFIITNNNSFKKGKGTFWANVYSETDAKNQPLDQELNDNQKQVLFDIGDNLENALVSNYDSIEYNDELIMYEMIDTLATSGILYDSVFLYSTNPEKAFYRLGFTNVGTNNGNYIQDINAANGRVYKWVEPIDNIPQGSYEPIVLLVTPKKKQMISLGGEYLISEKTKVYIDIGISNNDLNSFSSKNDDDNVGLALKSSIEQLANFKNTELVFLSNYEFKNQNFTSIERYRPSEFERDWNINNEKSFDEHFIQLKANLKSNQIKSSGLESAFLKSSPDHNGFRNQIHANWQYKSFEIVGNASYLTSNDVSYETSFLRHKFDLSKNIWKLKIGAGEEQELNRWISTDNDSLMGNSFNYFLYKIYVKTHDTLKTQFVTQYVFRDDYLPLNNAFEKGTNSKDVSFGFVHKKNANSQLNANIIFRSLNIYDTSATSIKPEENLLGRVDYKFKLFKGTFTSSTFYEIGTGLELKKEFSYVEVSPGQGTYTWSDYNENSIKELNEFDVAAFQDQANYIRVFLPTSEYIKTYQSQVNQVFGIYPYKIWRKQKGLKGVVSKFSDQLALRLERKISEQDYEKIFNVLNAKVNDSILINYTGSIRNTFSFNKTSSKFGIDQTFQSNKSKLLLVNGFDTRELTNYGLRFRWNIISSISLSNEFLLGDKKYTSEFFPSKNYDLNIIEDNVKLTFQPNVKYRVSLLSKYIEKENVANVEKSEVIEIGVESSYSILSKGILTAKASFLNINYKGDQNSSITYEMLEGYLPGKNYTWSVIGQYNLSNSLQLDISYSARANEDSEIIHNGTVQLRAFF